MDGEQFRPVFTHLLLRDIMWIVHALPIGIVLALFLSMVSDSVSNDILK